MSKYVMAYEHNVNLRELSLDEIECVNGGSAAAASAAAAIAAVWMTAFAAGYQAGADLAKYLN